MSKTERMTERVTVKMDANLKAKLQREAERCGGDSAFLCTKKAYLFDDKCAIRGFLFFFL